MVLGACLCIPAACGSRPPESDDKEAVAADLVEIQAGRRHVYEVEWSLSGVASDQGLLGGGAPLQGGVHLAGRLEMRVLEAVEGGSILQLQWLSLERHELQVMGQNTLEDPAALLMAKVWVLVPDDGDVRRLFFEDDAETVHRHLWRGLLSQVDFRRPPQTTSQWSALGPSGQGIARFDYQRTGNTVERTLEHYERVDALPGRAHDQGWDSQGHATMVLGAHGLPERIEAQELLMMSAGQDEIQFASEGTFALVHVEGERLAAIEAIELGKLTELDLTDPPDNTEFEQAVAQRFAEGLTAGDLSAEIMSVGNGLPPARGFMMRARGLLRGWPEQSYALRETFADARNHTERAFVLDVLVSADTPQAQEVICEVLEDPALRHSEAFGRLLQHLVSVQTPTSQLGVLLVGVHDEALAREDDELARAVLYPLGTAAGRLDPIDPPLSSRMQLAIRDAYNRAEDPASTVAALAGLGNAGRAEDLERIVAHLGAEDASVRMQVASSLTPYDVSSATEALYQLLDDRDRTVAAVALSSLLDHPEDQISRLAATAVAGDYHPQLAGVLVGAFAPVRTERPDAVAAMRALEAQTRDFRTARRINRLLRSGTPRAAHEPTEDTSTQ